MILISLRELIPFMNRTLERYSPDIPISTKHLGDCIRCAELPDAPHIIGLWLTENRCCDAQTTTIPCPHCSIEHQWQHYESQFNHLLDTISDELLPAHWRCSCLDQIHRPLHALSTLSEASSARDRVRVLLWELSVTTQYVRTSL